MVRSRSTVLILWIFKHGNVPCISPTIGWLAEK